MDEDTKKKADLNANVRVRQASWLKLDAERVSKFVEDQPIVRTVGKFELTFPLGEGISNGIGFLNAELDVGAGLIEHELVVRYSPGESLLKQKTSNMNS